MAWVGQIWQELVQFSNKRILDAKKNFSNWMHNGIQSEYGCAFINNDGKWAASYETSFCNTLRLCFICSIVHPPVFTLKGLCSVGSAFGWNFYLHINNSNEIEYFDGYKQLSKLMYNYDKYGNCDGSTKGTWVNGLKHGKFTH